MFPSVFEQDLEQEDFDPEEYLERLAWRLTNSDSAQNTGEIPDPEDLRGQLEDEIQNLQLFSDRCQGKIGRLQNQCNEEGEDFYLTLDRLQNENDNACRQLKQIGTEVNTVSSRIIQLGEQLQSVDAPRMRAQDALTLMKHFDEFMSECPLKSDAFLLYDSDYDKLLEAADIIQKLHMIAQELPDNKFKTVRSRIQDMYIAIEHKLIETFRTFQKYNKKQQMIRIVKILSHFSGYTDCLNAFVEECQIAAIRGPKTADVFDEILTMVSSNKDLVMEIFINPEEVLAKMVLNSFEENLREYVRSRLENLDDDEAFLTLLFELYSKTQQLITALSQFKISKDDDFLPRLSKNLFDRYLDKYIRTELTFLSEHFNDLLGAYYLKHKHQKKIITGGGIQDFKRDMQARFIPENYKISFLSEELAINILQETKHAFERCQLLSLTGQCATNVEQIFDLIVQYICHEHVEYAIELSLYGIPLGDTKTKPDALFVEVIQQTNAICHLLEKQFQDSVYPLIRRTPKESSCVEKKKTCLQVSKYFNEAKMSISEALDGDNLTICLSELGIRYHRVIVEHIYQFTYTIDGGVLLLCDLNEYRKIPSELGIVHLNKLFSVLAALCNLLVVEPHKLNDSCQADALSSIEKSIVRGFVQLRADFKRIPFEIR